MTMQSCSLVRTTHKFCNALHIHVSQEHISILWFCNEFASWRTVPRAAGAHLKVWSWNICTWSKSSKKLLSALTGWLIIRHSSCLNKAKEVLHPTYKTLQRCNSYCTKQNELIGLWRSGKYPIPQTCEAGVHVALQALTLASFLMQLNWGLTKNFDSALPRMMVSYWKVSQYQWLDQELTEWKKKKFTYLQLISAKDTLQPGGTCCW